MTREFSSIMELRNIREQKSRLSERETELSTPILTDLAMIPQLYSWFNEILTQRACPPDVKSVTQRKKFLFIVLFLFSPSVLAGGRLLNGIRTKLAEVFPGVAPCVISTNISDLVFIYQQYKDFRRDIEDIYIQIMERLKL